MATRWQQTNDIPNTRIVKPAQSLDQWVRTFDIVVHFLAQGSTFWCFCGIFNCSRFPFQSPSFERPVSMLQTSARPWIWSEILEILLGDIHNNSQQDTRVDASILPIPRVELLSCWICITSLVYHTWLKSERFSRTSRDILATSLLLMRFEARKPLGKYESLHEVRPQNHRWLFFLCVSKFCKCCTPKNVVYLKHVHNIHRTWRRGVWGRQLSSTLDMYSKPQQPLKTSETFETVHRSKQRNIRWNRTCQMYPKRSPAFSSCFSFFFLYLFFLGYYHYLSFRMTSFDVFSEAGVAGHPTLTGDLCGGRHWKKGGCGFFFVLQLANGSFKFTLIAGHFFFSFVKVTSHKLFLSLNICGTPSWKTSWTRLSDASPSSPEKKARCGFYSCFNG